MLYYGCNKQNINRILKMKHTEKYIITNWPSLAPFSKKLAGESFDEDIFYRVDFAVKCNCKKVYMWKSQGRKPMKKLNDLKDFIQICGGNVTGPFFDRPEKKFKCDEHYVVEWGSNDSQNDA